MKIIPAATGLELASHIIKDSGIVSFRTDTFYGLGVDPFNRKALRRLIDLKGDRDDKPILVVISDSTEADRFILERSDLFSIVSQKHWPGPLTIVLTARNEVPEELTSGTGTIGVRLPDAEDTRDFLRACGGALTATSANPSGQPPARTAQDVANYFPAGVDLILDGGISQSDKPSTVLDISKAVPRLIREGVISREELEAEIELT